MRALRITGGAESGTSVGQCASFRLAAVLLALHWTVALGGRESATGERASPARLQLRLDPNRATAAELQLLPGIGPNLAERIVAYRESIADGPAFRTAADLDRVQRIGPVLVERLKPYFRFADSPGETDAVPVEP